MTVPAVLLASVTLRAAPHKSQDSNNVRRCIASTIGLLLLTIAFARLSPSHAAPAGSELTMTLSSYIGGSQFTSIRDIATDSQGNFYLAGGTTSPDYPVTAGAFQTTHNPGIPESTAVEPFDAFVTKFDGTGHIVWSTFLGGPNYERAYAIEVDGAGNVYIAGRAGRGFPVTAKALQTTFNGGREAPFYGNQDGFIAKLSPDGSTLVWATYFGTSDFSIIRDLALDQQGDIYIASAYSSGSFSRPIADVFNNRPRGSSDALVAKVKGDGSGVIWATYIGGSLKESNKDSIRLDGAGNPYVLLSTESTDMPTTPGAYGVSNAGKTDLFVAKLASPDGRLLWGTYLGGPEGEGLETHELAVDFQGNAYVAADTRSPTFPTTPGAYQRSFGGGRSDIFVAKISAEGTELLASTFIGGSGDEHAEGVAVDRAGNTYFTGDTTSSNFPVTADAEQPALKGTRDAVVVKLAPDFSRLSYSSYLGGGRQDFGRAVGLDGQGVFYLGGETDSTDWPLRNLTSKNLTRRTAMFARFSPPGRP